jgi:hypothetical protein
VTIWLTDKSALVRFGTALMTPRAAPVCSRLPPLGSLGERLAASCSALPSGTDDEVGQVVAKSGWRLTVVVTAARLCSGDS